MTSEWPSNVHFSPLRTKGVRTEGPGWYDAWYVIALSPKKIADRNLDPDMCNKNCDFQTSFYTLHPFDKITNLQRELATEDTSKVGGSRFKHTQRHSSLASSESKR